LARWALGNDSSLGARKNRHAISPRISDQPFNVVRFWLLRQPMKGIRNWLGCVMQPVNSLKLKQIHLKIRFNLKKTVI
jgi:hypothetical protein